MKARQLIGSATFEPKVLRAIGQAFDEAWDAIRPSVGTNPLGIEATRLSLANIVLSLAKQDSCDVEALKAEALRIFQLKRQISNLCGRVRYIHPLTPWLPAPRDDAHVQVPLAFGI